MWEIIIGAGIGGLSTAIAMQMRHINVKIFEAATNIAFREGRAKSGAPHNFTSAIPEMPPCLN